MDHQSSAIKNGVIQDWEAMEELWRHGFHKLGVATEDEAWKVGQGQGQGRHQGQFSISEDLFASYSQDPFFFFLGNLTEKYQLQSHCKEWVNKDFVNKKAFQ